MALSTPIFLSGRPPPGLWLPQLRSYELNFRLQRTQVLLSRGRKARRGEENSQFGDFGWATRETPRRLIRKPPSPLSPPALLSRPCSCGKKKTTTTESLGNKYSLPKYITFFFKKKSFCFRRSDLRFSCTPGWQVQEKNHLEGGVPTCFLRKGTLPPQPCHVIFRLAPPPSPSAALPRLPSPVRSTILLRSEG